VNPCWVERMEADTRYAYREDTYDRDAPLWHADCDAACIAEEAAHEAFGGWGGCSSHSVWGCPMSTCFVRTAQAMCVLDKGHTGAHEFAPQNEIAIEFPAVQEARS